MTVTAPERHQLGQRELGVAVFRAASRSTDNPIRPNTSRKVAGSRCTIGPRQTTSGVFGTKNPIEINLTPWLSAGAIFAVFLFWGFLDPHHHRDVRSVDIGIQQAHFGAGQGGGDARLTDTVDLPTPPCRC